MSKQNEKICVNCGNKFKPSVDNPNEIYCYDCEDDYNEFENERTS